MKRDPCRIMLRWYAWPCPRVFEWLVAKKTAYLLTKVHVSKRADHYRLSITALRFAIPDVPADAVVHAFHWDPRGKKK